MAKQLNSTCVKLGERLLSAYKMRGMTQETVAEKANISTKYTSDIVRGYANPTLHVLQRLADAMQIPLWELMIDNTQAPLEACLQILCGIYDVSAEELSAAAAALASQKTLDS